MSNQDSRMKNSLKNMMTGFLYQLVMLVLSFVSKTVFIHTLGKDYLGMNAIFTDVLSLLSMADLGFGTAMAYSFYKPLAEKNHQKIAALIAFYKKIYSVIAMAVLLLGLGCIPFLDVIIKPEKEIPNLVIYYLFSLANVVISYMFVYKTTLLDADQKNYKLTTIRMVINFIKTFLQIVVLTVFHDYIVFLAVGFLCQLMNNIIASKYTEKEYPYIKGTGKQEMIDEEVKQGLWKNMKSVFIYKFSVTMYTATDNIIISSIIGTAIVGVYSNYLMISSKLLLIEQIIFSAMTASVGNIVARETSKKKLEVFHAMQSVSFIFCGILAATYCTVANELVYVWLGESFVVTTLTVIAISINTYFSAALQPLWIYRDATGLYQRTKWIMLAGAVLNIVLSVVLGSMIGLPGVIFASAISRICTYFWYEPRVLFKEYFDASANGYYVSILKNILIVAVMVCVWTIGLKGFHVNSWLTIAIKAVIVGLGNSVVFFAVYCKTEGFQIIVRKVQSKLHRNK